MAALKTPTPGNGAAIVEHRGAWIQTEKLLEAVREKIADNPACGVRKVRVSLRRRAQPRVSEGMALPLRGNRSRFTRDDLVAYFGHERLKLPMSAIEPALARIARGVETWPAWIERSFLPLEAKSRYLALIEERRKRLGM